MAATKQNRGNAKERDFTFHHDQETLFEEVEIFAPLSKKQELYLQDETNDIILWGGAASSGKSHLSLLKLMIDCIEDKNYNSLLLRESLVQIKAPGSIWEEGCRMFDNVGASSNQVNNQWRFPNGSFVKCHYLKANQNDFQGSQIHSALIDEAAQIKNIDDIWYITSRLRGKGSKRKQLRMTCNPDRNSPLCKWLVDGGYLLEDGLPNPEMDGVTTYLLQIQGEFQFFKSRKEIEEVYGKNAAKGAYSFVYYAANVYDNPAVVKDQPEYIFKLENMKRLERERLLLGNWFASNSGAGHFNREDIKEIEPSEVPLGLPTVRSWDLAASKPDPEKGGRYADPDWTRGTLCSYDRETGSFYILGMKSIRERSALVDNLMMKTAREDGQEVYTTIPQDSGAAGKSVAEQKRTKLLSQGNKPIITKARKSKLARAENFLIACQSGNVFIVKGAFSDSNYAELENFDGDKNNGHHDDVMDTLADAWETLVNGRLIPTIKLSKSNPRLNNLFGKTLLS
ncbi:terminase large subunit domain-containing protein [Halomonas salinarum]|uniref:terminase large subunit domain-containing protein n=1 Tax=Halomonas salinarum TaxID=1158993 RepID=UPI001439041E|nr:terminase family protein [Halomonas salinarum]